MPIQRGLAYRLSLLLFLLLTAAFGQGTDAVVSGTVTDPDGAVIPNTAVAAANTKTGVVTTVKSNEAGVYLFAALQPGSYRIRVQHDGFQKFVMENVELEVSARPTINIALKLGQTAETVTVQATADQLATDTSTVGTVVTGQKLLDLPLVGRSAYDLLQTQAGTSPSGQNFNGARAGALNITLDGVNMRNNLYDSLATSTNKSPLNVDRIEEFRMVTSPADAEYGRGSGQVQAVTRGGTNQFHGSLFEEHRDTDLTANTWFNNQRGSDSTDQPLSPRNFLVRNQFGGRVGGPIRRNKTFFNIYYEGSRQVTRNSSTTTVYTPTALQGLYRFFPGVRNGNALAAVPVVDSNGNPVQPAGATGSLQTVSIYGRDPNRMTADPSGIIAKLLGPTPAPNNWQVGDGLNTAGYTFQRKSPTTSDQYDIRIDNQFTSNHRLSFTLGRYTFNQINGLSTFAFPTSPQTNYGYDTTNGSLAFTSVLRPNLLNEFRLSVFRPYLTLAPLWGNDMTILPHANGQALVPGFTMITNPIPYNDYGNTDGDWQICPVYQLGNTTTWLKGRHSFKGGFEVRFNSFVNMDNFVVVPRVALGAVNVPVQNINATAIPGLGTNQAAAQQVLTELAGSVSQVFQRLNSAGGTSPTFTPGLNNYLHIVEPEFSAFFKDDFKVTPNLTLNLGMRYERYWVPAEITGKELGLVGGSAGIFGPSGTNMGALFQPGAANGSLTVPLPVGPKTPNPGGQLFADSNKNFAPAIGATWALPGHNRLIHDNNTVIRAGYSIGYVRDPLYLPQEVINNSPGYTNTPNLYPSTATNIGQVALPLSATSAPLAPIPLTNRTQAVYAFESNLKTPYYQNWNISLQRALNRDTVLEARYVGNKGTDLLRGVNINEVNIFENGLLDAFKITQAGGQAPLFDRIFMGVGGVNGTTVRGSDYVRSNATLQPYLANNNPGALASFINTQGAPAGSYLRNAGLPENSVVASPQFGAAWLLGNFSNSTYHALQIDLIKRYSKGVVFQANYTWSKVLGDYEGNDNGYLSTFRTLRDRSLDKQILSYSRAHVVHVNGIWELPFGPGKLFGRNAHGVLGRMMGGWQAGWIATIYSGQPVSLYAANAFNQVASAATPVAAGAFSNGTGGVQRTGNGVVYFAGLHPVQDPYISNIAPSLRSQSTLQAIADSSGKVLLQNPAPGQFGNLAQNFIAGPGFFDLDLNLLKRIRIAERKEFIIRVDAMNSTNTPSFSNPNTDINNPNFGRITATASGPRIVVAGARFNF